jgi:hypothetical protein
MTDIMRALIVTHKVGIVAYLSEAANDPASHAAALEPDHHYWPHSPAMNSVELARFTARLAQFTDQGLIDLHAESLADRLVIRDREHDDRATCLECTHLQRGWRCGNWQLAGVAIHARDAQLCGDFVSLLQRCDGFKDTNQNRTSLWSANPSHP